MNAEKNMIMNYLQILDARIFNGIYRSLLSLLDVPQVFEQRLIKRFLQKTNNGFDFLTGAVTLWIEETKMAKEKPK